MVKYKTQFTEKTGVKYPLIMGAFAGLGKASFAGPFSEAGGLGIVTAHNFRSVKRFRKELEKMSSLTSKPFGVNFSVAPPIDHFANLMQEKDFMPYVEAAIDFGVKTMTTSAYRAKEIGARLHESGCVWIHKCATLNHAVSSEKHGADFVVIVGLEGTGFKNPLQNTTLINMTVANKILKVPKIAAGGIADARGFLAALMMGASAVCLGTLLMATEECPASQRFKESKLVERTGYDDGEFHKKIYHLELRDSPVPSMSVCLINDIVSMKERIGRIISEADKILEKWGLCGTLDLT
ncbi:MAG: nitronate monooxygenase [Promethearchaeota archaeon]|nr:MAG: nitronate monooxygenase [Candidatus Lokiarchaeota archaeon]